MGKGYKAIGKKAKKVTGGNASSEDGKRAGGWTLGLIVFLTMFSLFKTQLSAIWLIQFMFTLGGIAKWFDMVTGIFIIASLFAVYDTMQGGRSYIGGILVYAILILTIFLVGATFTDVATQTEFTTAALALAGLGGPVILIMIAGKR